jgi:hypothetical protein
MIEIFIFGFLLVIYATGCLASIVEIYDQTKTGAAPSAGQLAREHPLVNILANVALIAGWPLSVTWHSVRRGWR